MSRAIIILCCGLVLGLRVQAQPDLQAEYFFDADPGVGNGVPLAMPTGPSPSLSATLDISSLSAGVHTWYARTRENGVWGFYGVRRLFLIWEPAELSNPPTDIETAEYFFDADPGVGNGFDLPITPGASLSESMAIVITGLSEGLHLWYVRTKQNGVWGHYGQRRLFYLWGSESVSPPTDIDAAEYFFDADPGVGNGTPLVIMPGGSLAESVVIDITGLAVGFHKWYVRTKQNGAWGFYGERKLFLIWDPGTTLSPTDIEAAEYFIDSDPGVGNGTVIPITPGPSPLGEMLIDITGLSVGTHKWNVRTKQNGKWGHYGVQRTFSICPEDAEPAVAFTPSASCTNGTFTVDVTMPAGWGGAPYWVINSENAQTDTLSAGESATYGPFNTGTELLFTAGSSLDPMSCTKQYRATLSCWYEDADSDGFGDPLVSVVAVAQPPGYVADDSDNCPTNPLKIEPGVCGCGVADITTTWYEDADNDGFGDPLVSQPGYTCIQPTGYVEDSSDNCPTDPLKIEPGVCGCGTADVPTTWYADADNDGFGDPLSSQAGYTCIQPPGYVEDGTDDCPELSGLIGDACDDNDPYSTDDLITGACLCIGTPVPVGVSVRVTLDGPYDPTTGLMNDALRTLPSFPLSDPYPALGYAHTGTGNGGAVSPATLSIAGNDAIVDWVIIELRDATDPGLVIASRSGLLQRDGDVVEPDGTSPLTFAVYSKSYHLSALHRNHLGVMTQNTFALTPIPTVVDLGSSGVQTYGSAARRSITGAFPTEALWSGDVDRSGVIMYVGSPNDRDPILVLIGGSEPTAIATGYLQEDVDMDGTAKYVGEGNDRDPILLNIGGSIPTATRTAQLP